MALQPTVEDALLLLAGRSSTPNPGPGFNDSDVSFGHALAERVAQGIPLSAKQRRAAYRILVRYVDQLRAAGIEYGAIDLGDDSRSPAVVAAEARAMPREAFVASVENDRIVVRSPFSMKDAVKAIPTARWQPKVAPRGAWTFPASPRAALNVRDALGPLGCFMDDSILPLIETGEIHRAAARHKTADDLPPVPGEVLPSWMHQRQAFWFARELDSALLAMDMGTGKSKVAVDLARDWGARSTIIVCPLKVLGVWPKQFRLHARPEEFHVENGLVRVRDRWEPDTVDARTTKFDNLLHECGCGRAHIVVVNYEMAAFQPFKDWALEQVWDLAVGDEIHRWRAPQGVWSRWAASLRDRAARRLGLTGTPMGQSMLDVFGEYRFLDNTIFGNSYTSFEHRYAVKGGYQNHEVVALRVSPTLPLGGPNPYFSPKIAREFDDKFFSIAYEVGAEVLDLPEAFSIERVCDMPPKARKLYNEYRDDLYADLQEWNGGESSAPNVLVKMLRLQQLTGGYITDDDGNDIQIHDAKESLLEEVLQDIDPSESIVVVCRFIPDLQVVERVAARLGRPYAEVSGGRGDGLTEDSTLALDHGITGVQIQAGGVGVDFTKCAFPIFYSVGYSLIDFKQAIKRFHRPGQTRPVRFIHLQAASSIDQDVYESLRNNEQNIELVMKRRLLARTDSQGEGGEAHAVVAMADALTAFEGF